MGRRQQFAWRLSPQGVRAVRGVDPVGRVRLTTLELLNRDRTDESLDVFRHVALEPGNVEFKSGADILGSGKELGAGLHMTYVSRPMARQPMSRRQNPCGQSMTSTAS